MKDFNWTISIPLNFSITPKWNTQFGADLGDDGLGNGRVVASDRKSVHLAKEQVSFSIDSSFVDAAFMRGALENKVRNDLIDASFP